MKKFLETILKENGEWSFRRTTALYILHIAIIYAFLPVWILGFDIKEFVFWGFITYSGTMVGMVLKEKLSGSATDNTNNSV